MNTKNLRRDVGSYPESLNTIPLCKRRVVDTDWFQAVDVSDTGDEYLLRFDLPGLAREEIQISLDEDALFLVGTRMNQQSAGKRLRVERPVGAFARRLVLPPDSCSDAMYATIQEGVLRLHVPKNTLHNEKQGPRTIPSDETDHEYTHH